MATKRVAESGALGADAEDWENELLELGLECPLSHEMFQEPVVAVDGYTYEVHITKRRILISVQKRSIEEWIAQKGDAPTSPTTNALLPSKELYPNLTLKSVLQRLSERRVETNKQQKRVAESKFAASENARAAAEKRLLGTQQKLDGQEKVQGALRELLSKTEQEVRDLIIIRSNTSALLEQEQHRRQLLEDYVKRILIDALPLLSGPAVLPPIATIPAASHLYQVANDLSKRSQHSLAFEYYTKAATQGLIAAELALARCYVEGHGVEKSLASAVLIYQRLMTKEAVAQRELALLYLNNPALDAGYGSPAELLKKAADRGDAEAQYELGVCYQEEKRVARDAPQALQCFLQAASKGHAPALGMLGDLYEYGEGVEMDTEKAYGYYKQAADLGDSDGEGNVARCLLIGIGTERNQAKAISMMTKLAERGHAESAKLLGYSYLHGKHGMAKDAEKGFELLHAAAEKNNAEAQYLTGNSYYEGIGVDVDHNVAADYYRRAAPRYAAAQRRLGECYLLGNGVAKERSVGLELLQQAASRGDRPALRILEDQGEKLEPRIGSDGAMLST